MTRTATQCMGAAARIECLAEMGPIQKAPGKVAA